MLDGNSVSVISRVRTPKHWLRMLPVFVCGLLACTGCGKKEATVEDVERLVKELAGKKTGKDKAKPRSADYAEQRDAAIDLGKIGDTRSVAPLIKALSHTEWPVRQAAAEALGKISEKKSDKATKDPGAVAFATKEAVAPLVKALCSDPSWPVRKHAALALGKIGDKATTEHLIKALAEPDIDVSAAAAEALGMLHDESSLEPLIAVIESNAWHARIPAIRSLGKMKNPKTVEPLVKALKDKVAHVRAPAAEALGNIGDKTAVQPLIATLTDKDLGVRAAAIAALSNIGDAAAIAPLVEQLTSADLGSVALQGLEKLGWKPASNEEKQRYAIAKQDIEQILAAVNETGGPLRALAADALGRISDKERLKQIKDLNAAGALADALKDERPEVRAKAALALGTLGDEKSVEPLIKLMADVSNPAVRRAAAAALGSLGDEKAIPPLKAALQDKDLGPAAAMALQKLKWKQASAEEEVQLYLTMRAVEPLVSALGNEKPDVRIAAVHALAKLADKGAIPALTAALIQWDPVPLTVRLLELCDPFGLARPEAKAVDRRAFADDARSIRTAAAEALSKIAEKEPGEATRALVSALESWDGGPLALAALQKLEWRPNSAEDKVRLALASRAVEPLIEALADNKCTLRTVAAEALGKIGGQQVLKPLADALNDGDAEIRLAALAALGTMTDKEAEPVLVNALENWMLAPAAATALASRGWKPASPEERTHLAAARRDRKALLADWEAARRVLTADLAAEDAHKVTNAACALIGIGRAETLADLVMLLESKGTGQIADIFTNSEKDTLAKTASAWAEKHKHTLSAPPEQFGVKWGRMQSTR